MATISAGQLRNGITFELEEDKIVVVIDFLQVKQARGASFIRTKLRDLVTGRVIEKTFNPSEKFPLAKIDRKEMSFCYEDGGFYYFMDLETYEQIPIKKSLAEDALKYIKEDIPCTVSFYKQNPFSVEPPNFVELKITYCEPGVKGNTATGATKPATLETGLIVNVPLFVNEGDVIRIDTRDGQYMSRV